MQNGVQRMLNDWETFYNEEDSRLPDIVETEEDSLKESFKETVKD